MMQVGRTLFFLWAVRGERRSLVRNFQRILAWLSLSAAFWIAGGLATEPMRPVWWAIALAIEVIAPALPGSCRPVEHRDWDVDMAEAAAGCS
jgi:low temperature requirement protein LtrA